MVNKFEFFVFRLALLFKARGKGRKLSNCCMLIRNCMHKEIQFVFEQYVLVVTSLIDATWGVRCTA